MCVCVCVLCACVRVLVVRPLCPAVYVQHDVQRSRARSVCCIGFSAFGVWLVLVLVVWRMVWRLVWRMAVLGAPLTADFLIAHRVPPEPRVEVEGPRAPSAVPLPAAATLCLFF